MHLRSNKFLIALFVVLLAGLVGAQNQPASNSPAQVPGSLGTYDIPTPDGPASTAPPSSSEQRQPPATTPQTAPQQGPAAQTPEQGRAPETQRGDVYVFRAYAREVQLYATVVDDRNRLVTGLDRSAFAVYEDGKPQKITSFDMRDIPVALGIIIDNSGSMRDKRQAVNEAALNLVKASNPKDQVFVVNYNDEFWLDQDYTSNVTLLQEALEKIESRGGTAMYDAVVAAADHLKAAPLEKKILLVVTDGEDNASRLSLEQAIRRLQDEGGPTVYTIGILGGESRQKRAMRALRELAEQTGGVAFFPKDVDEVMAISNQVAHDIRNQYFIGYRPDTPQSEGGYRTVKVEAKARGYGRLQVRTKSGYYAGSQQQAAAAR